MIRNEQELQAALQWIGYWKSTRTVGQSWLGNEQAASKIAGLRRDVDEYRRRQGQAAGTPPVSAEEQPI